MSKGFTTPGARGLNGVLQHAHGQFRKKAQAAGKTTRAFAEDKQNEVDKSGNLTETAHQARLAMTLMGMHHGGGTGGMGSSGPPKGPKGA